MTDITPSLVAITETGSRYEIDTRNKFWRKNGERWERLIQMKVGEYGSLPWTHPEDWTDALAPEVGKSLFLRSLDTWWRSTPVVDIEFLGDRQ